MNNIKKYLLVSLVSFFALIGCVNAASAIDVKIGDTNIEKTILPGNDGLKYEPSGLYSNANGKKFYVLNYRLKYKNNTYISYCLDPNGAAANELKVAKILTQDSSEKYRVFGSGIKAILENGYREDNRSYAGSNLSENDFYAATSIAVRAYTIGLWGLGNRYATSEDSELYYLHGIIGGQYWGKNDIGQDALNNVLNNNGHLFTGKNNNVFFTADKNSNGQEVLRVAKELFIKGAQASKDYASGKTPKIVDNGLTMDSTSKDGDKITKEYTLTLGVSNFSDKGVLNSLNVVPSGNGVDIVAQSTDISVDGKSVGNASSLSNLNLKGVNTISIKIKAVSNTSDDCTNPVIKVDYKYSDVGLGDLDVLFKDTIHASSAQRFVALVTTNGAEGSITKTLNLCDNACKTNINIPCDCSELPNSDGKTTDNDNSNPVNGSITTDDNVQKCILNKNDEAGNSYKLAKTNGGVTSDNPYCQVFCKEDYTSIKLPGIKGIDSGRYFQLQSKISGTKTCYTAGTSSTNKNSINIEKYEDDIYQAQERLVGAYNEYLRMQTAMNTPVKVKTATCCSECGGTYENYSIESTSSYSYNVSKSSNGQASISRAGGLSYSDSADGSTSCPCTCNGTDAKGNCTGTTCTCGGCQSGDRAGLESRRSSAYNTAVTELENAKTNYLTIIKQYKECTSDSLDNGWKNNYEFAQYIKYSYDEPYISLIKDENGNKMVFSEDTANAKTDNEYCTGSIDNKYNCQSGQSSSIPTKNLSYILCDKNGCGVDQSNRDIPYARYVKRSVTRAGTYTTNNIFYNAFATGTVTTKSTSDDKIQTQQINGLPVSLKTQKGVYNFKLDLYDLGEFYDQSNNGKPVYGRLAGNDKSVYNYQYQQGTIGCNGEYVCHYKVNCPECTFTCAGSNDDKKCTIDDCPVCQFKCTTCVNDDNQLQLHFRPISTNNVKLNNGTSSGSYSLGYNWDVKSEYKVISSKADATITEIEKDGDSVYDKTPMLSVTMTPGLASEIRSYNNTAEKNGGYSNDSLTCYDYDSTYKNIFCFSDFLDSMSKDHAEAFTFVNQDGVHRPTSEERTTSGKIVESKYWTTYIQKTTETLNGVGNVGGPSWK